MGQWQTHKESLGHMWSSRQDGGLDQSQKWMRSGSKDFREIVSAELAEFAVNLLLVSLSGCVLPSSWCLLRTEEVCAGGRATKDLFFRSKSADQFKGTSG